MITLRLNPLPQSVNAHELGTIRQLIDVKLADDMPPEVLDLIYKARLIISEAMLKLSVPPEVIH